MKVFAIQKTQTNTYALKTYSNNSSNPITFSAKRLPSGDYSDWFVEMIESNIHNISKKMSEHLAKFRKEETDAFIFGRFFAGKEIDRNVLTRENDCLKVAEDLKSGHKPANIGKQYYEYDDEDLICINDIKGSYSSPQDYANRSARIEYVPDDVPDTDLSNGT